jgi:hypothetical protein
MTTLKALIRYLITITDSINLPRFRSNWAAAKAKIFQERVRVFRAKL